MSLMKEKPTSSLLRFLRRFSLYCAVSLFLLSIPFVGKAVQAMGEVKIIYTVDVRGTLFPCA